MFKTRRKIDADKITVTTETLATMLDCGRATAVQVGTEAKARVQFGRRVLWNLRKIQSFVDDVTIDKEE